MKNLLILLSLTVVFACHTKEEQKHSGVNDPTNLIYSDIDRSVLTASQRNAPAPAAARDTPSPSTACIDTSKIEPDAMCTQEYKPVCGCDNKEYSNQCEAEKAGVTSWTDGPCTKGDAKKEGEKSGKPTSVKKPETKTNAVAEKEPALAKKDTKKKKRKDK